MKKRISRKDWTEIGRYNYAAKWLRPFCSYTLIKEDDGRFKREQRVNLLVYIIIFIPFHLIQALYCLWDGGLKEFEICDRYLGGDWFVQDSPCWHYSKKVWDSKS